MAFASSSILSKPAATVQRQASLIPRSVDRTAVRSRLPCGCASHKHTCSHRTLITARAGGQGSTSVGATCSATPIPTTPSFRTSLPSRNVSVGSFAPAVRTARRSASVSAVDLRSFLSVGYRHHTFLSSALYDKHADYLGFVTAFCLADRTARRFPKPAALSVVCCTV